MRHLVLAHRDLDLHAGIVDLAEHLGDAADRLRVQRRRLHQLDGDDLSCLGVGDAVARHDDVLAVALVFGREQPNAALVEEAPMIGAFLRSRMSRMRPSGRPFLS